MAASTRILVLLLLLGASCATAPRARDEGGEEWVSATGEHLFVETDLGASLAPTLVRELENARSAMAAALLPDARAPRQPLEVVVIGARELGAMRYELAGVYSDRPFVGPALIVSDEDRWKRRSVMRHELAHAVVAENLHDVPQWLNEGLAVLLATADVDERTGEVTWGRILTPQEAWNANWISGLTTIDRLLDREPWSGGEMGRFEFSAGLLVRMLAHKHPSQLRCLLTSLSRAEPYEEAMDDCLPNMRSWAHGYAAEANEADGDVGKTSIEPYKHGVVVEPMHDGDVHAVLALVNLVVAGTNHEDDERAALLEASKRHRQRALELDDTQILAASLELSSRTVHDPCSEAKLAGRLVKKNRLDWRAWFWQGHVGCTPLDVREAAHEHAWRLAPSRPEVLAARADDACRKKDWKACETLARQSQTDGDLDIASGELLFQSLEQQGRCEDAKRLIAEDDELAKSVAAEIAKRDSRFNADRTIHCMDPPGAAASAPASR